MKSMFLKFQISLYEFLIVSFIFLLFFILTILTHLKKENEFYQYYEIYLAQKELKAISNFFNFEGFPVYWDCNNFEKIGFLNDNFINLTKLNETNKCYEKIRIKELISSNFCIILNSSQFNNSYGNCNFSNSKLIFNQKRFVPLKISYSEASQITIILWK